MKYFFGIVPPLSIYEKLMSVRNQYHYSGVEPHITVKLSYGTGTMLPVNWMSECKRIIEGFRSFSVSVGELRYFGDKDVLYIGAHSPELIELHRKLVAVFEPTEEQTKRCFELNLYIPHLTVAKKESLSEEILEEMGRTLSPHFRDRQTFDVHEIRLYARDDQTKTFQKYEDIQMTR
ncbi:2'-5' RNA ligase family protein [Paenibacillus alvei]|uniref:2'-5' RNA ligase family protein n=1 Tax=Paenibacillus alvei TaxID=44250 RepID=A0ABT4ECG4_PAEAL|nr:2'-5' RNA ligase family protein [Paenibacillus alvei]EPY11066.1 hypothetical protein PAAL66ix_19719 [Paenibacillus alvei A6-6i-x]MCY9531429.1 2'-5' RNA ligase family protein [Paenibacillus alvei]